MPTILHIATHMGGGVGKALSGISCYSQKQNSPFTHRILLLEEPKNREFVDACRNCGILLSIVHNPDEIRADINAADIVQLEWWHHPKMAEFLHNFPQLPVRLVIWSHVSGCSYPYLPPEFILLPHRFLFTSRCSLDNPYWSASQKMKITRNAGVVNSSGDFSAYYGQAPVSHDHFRIGYLGTLAPSKIHPEFVDFCREVTVPDSRFIMIGDIPEPNMVETEAEHQGIADRFEFLGHVPDVGSALSRLDAFGYLLNPDHYGTTENALLEAMAAGLAVVVLDQCAEKYLVRHGKTGLLVKNKEEYGRAIKYLYENPQERSRLGRNARDFIRSELDLPVTAKKLEAEYAQVLGKEKTCYSFGGIFGSQPYEWFLAGLSRERRSFLQSIDADVRKDPARLARIERQIKDLPAIFKSPSKSSINQYREYFPEDRWLNYWFGLINAVEP